MVILGIETSCDETAISLIECTGNDIAVLGDKTLSQIELHKQYGGVFPNMAKREHSRNLLPLFKTVLEESKLRIFNSQFPISNETGEKIKEILNREPELLEQFLEFIPTIEKPTIDAIAVTEGPGLEPCLWTGINLAKSLALVWDIPVIPVNHMEGHIFSALLRKAEIFNDQFPISKQLTKRETTNYELLTTDFPAIALLVSGGHTELVLVKEGFEYEIIGETRDDAVGEAFDKVARLLGLPYPGGPQISALAEEARSGNSSFPKGGARVGEGGGFKNPSAHQNEPLPLGKGELKIELPRPMLHSKDFDFSFSGLKTAVLYLLKKISTPDDDTKKAIALEFENAVTDVLVAKTKAAMERYGARALLIGGGVIANTHIRRKFEALGTELKVAVHIPERGLTTDNALMIAVAGYQSLLKGPGAGAPSMKARGNRRLDEKEESV